MPYKWLALLISQKLLQDLYKPGKRISVHYNRISQKQRLQITWFFNNPQIIAAWGGNGVLARYLRTPLELGRLESSNWSDISIKRRAPISIVVIKICSKAELVTASNSAIPVTTTCGRNFFISSIIKSDWRGASITVIPLAHELSFSLCWNF